MLVLLLVALGIGIGRCQDSAASLSPDRASATVTPAAVSARHTVPTLSSSTSTPVPTPDHPSQSAALPPQSPELVRVERALDTVIDLCGMRRIPLRKPEGKRQGGVHPERPVHLGQAPVDEAHKRGGDVPRRYACRRRRSPAIASIPAPMSA